MNFVKVLPYGRNNNRKDLSLVIKELKGSCSSKHAFLKKIAQLNDLPNIRLMLCIYKMDHFNTPKIRDVLTAHSLDYIPEAHCYLAINEENIDLTTKDSDFEKLEKYILEEFEIEPEQVNEFKVEFHRNYIKNWIVNNKVQYTFDELWNIREKCIYNISFKAV